MGTNYLERKMDIIIIRVWVKDHPQNSIAKSNYQKYKGKNSLYKVFTGRITIKLQGEAEQSQEIIEKILRAYEFDGSEYFEILKSGVWERISP